MMSSDFNDPKYHKKISLKYFILDAIGQKVTTNIFILIPFSFFQILSYYFYSGVLDSHLII